MGISFLVEFWDNLVELFWGQRLISLGLQIYVNRVQHLHNIFVVNVVPTQSHQGLQLLEIQNFIFGVVYVAEHCSYSLFSPQVSYLGTDWVQKFIKTESLVLCLQSFDQRVSERSLSGFTQLAHDLDNLLGVDTAWLILIEKIESSSKTFIVLW